MSKPEFFATPGYGERQLRTFHYSQAVKIGNRVETSGQGGWKSRQLWMGGSSGPSNHHNEILPTLSVSSFLGT